MARWLPRAMVFALAGIALTLIWFPLTPAGAQNDFKIAVVDISKVFNDHPDVDALEQEIRGEQEKLRGEYNAMIERIGKLKDEQRELEEGSALWREKDVEIAVLKEETKIRGKGAEEDLTQMAMDATNKLLDDIEKKIRRYCQQNGITVCLKVDTIPLRGSGMQLAFKSVLYSEPAIDITQEITDIMKKQ